jgi:ricin-type beta-trefoil lectin protein
MLIAALRRRGLARLGVAVAVASVLTIALTGAPANAAAGTGSMAKAFATGVIATGTYRWENANSGLCLAYDPESRGASRQEGCDNDNTIFWDTVNIGGDNFELIDEHNGQCLTIPDNSTANGAAPFVYICGGGGAQIFTLVPESSPIFAGAYQIMNTNSNKCVDVGGAQTNKGAWIVQFDCLQRGDLMWRPFN